MLKKIKIKRALVSVSDKKQVVELSKMLEEFDVEIISTGGTKKVLEDAGIQVRDIQNFTGNPEAFNGRMKSLSFKVSSSLLFRRDDEDDAAEAEKLEIEPIDLVVCNLYPFEKKVDGKKTFEELVEEVDVGGPTMLRSAAKNFRYVCSLSDVSDYELFKHEFVSQEGCISVETSKRLALKTFRNLSNYDSCISKQIERDLFGLEQSFHFSIGDSLELRYGENPHQRAYVCCDTPRRGLASANQLQGKELSYNNFLDADAAINCVRDLNKISSKEYPYACCIVKHSNPCGLSLCRSELQACEEAWKGDPISSFGSIIALNFEVVGEVAEFFSQYFVEVIIAPSFSKDAIEIFKRKKNLRLLEYSFQSSFDSYSYRSIDGGVLIQDKDKTSCPEYSLVTSKTCDIEKQKKLLDFSHLASKFLKSNAIALCHFDEGDGFRLIGAGMGNPNRLVSIKQCFEKACENGFSSFSDCVLASDAFFPFQDNIELIAKYGNPLILQPGGSIKDDEVIMACNERQFSMIFTSIRNFNH